MKIRVFNRSEMNTPQYLEWLKDITNFLSTIGMNRGSAKIRAWEYGIPLQDIELKSSDICLDTGSYNTYIGTYLAQFVSKMYVTDSFEWSKRDYIKAMNRPSPKEWMEKVRSAGKNIFPVQDSISESKWENERFDNVFCFSTIEHVPNHEKAIQELWRVLKPGGQLLLTTDISNRGQRYQNYGRIYTPAQIGKLFSKIGVSLPPFTIPNNREDLAFDTFTCMSIYLRK